MPHVLIIGAGLSGLTCALQLHRKGIPFQIIEASDGIGGRVRTDQIDGFLLDRGFQVYLDAYPEAGKLLNLPALDLKSFEPGALVFDGTTLHPVMDVFRRPASVFSSALAPIGSLADKLRVAKLRFQLLTKGTLTKDQKTESFLQNFGFSPRIIDSFFRSFYGGIFLENDLRTSSRMFAFTFRMFTRGSATLPARGMQAIPDQIAERLPSETIRLNSPVASIDRNTVTLRSGEKVVGSHLILATGAHHAAKLLPDFAPQAPEWRAVTNLYFSAPKAPFPDRLIALNGSQQGLINNIAIISNIAPSYAPADQALLSVSLLGIHQDEDLPAIVLSELQNWFGVATEDYRHLRTDHIRHALPEQRPNHASPGYLKMNELFLCGDHTTTASIEGAIISGKKTADALLKSL